MTAHSLNEELMSKNLSRNGSEYRRLRIRAIQLYGGKCSRCGFSDWRALHFDHVHGGGNQRKIDYSRNPSHVIKCFGKDIFQLLCANCNNIKIYENGEGTHSTTNASVLSEMEKFFSEDFRLSMC
jgi:hypothetical protein